jgi:hypothetical protein
MQMLLAKEAEVAERAEALDRRKAEMATHSTQVKRRNIFNLSGSLVMYG